MNRLPIFILMLCLLANFVVAKPLHDIGHLQSPTTIEDCHYSFHSGLDKSSIKLAIVTNRVLVTEHKSECVTTSTLQLTKYSYQSRAPPQ